MRKSLNLNEKHMKLFNFIIMIYTCNVYFLECTDRPVIGILPAEFVGFGFKYYPATTYIPASYVKAVEAAGARVVPVLLNQNLTYYKQILRSINGVVVPGGNSSLQPRNPHYDAFVSVYKVAKQMNDEGIFFPILGVCSGFQAFMILTNNHVDVQTRCEVIDLNFPLIFPKNFRQSLTFASLPDDIYIYLKYFDVTKNHHSWCTSLQNFTKYALDTEWRITTTTIDLHGFEFISSIEHKKYPFVGLQYHPEKVYEWDPTQNNPHSKTAFIANRYFYDLLVNLARMNGNKFSKKIDEKNALISNYNPQMGDFGDYFDQVYVFILKWQSY